MNQPIQLPAMIEAILASAPGTHQIALRTFIGELISTIVKADLVINVLTAQRAALVTCVNDLAIQVKTLDASPEQASQAEAAAKKVIARAMGSAS